jgi:GT2 family glycosyltransferase
MEYIAVLMTCFNRREKTIICLENLFKNKLPKNYKFEVFLVDDGSTDGTSETVKENFPQVNIIQGNGNLYWNQGMRLAWDNASNTNDFDFYIWLNDDVQLFSSSLKDLISASEQKGKAIISGVMKSQKTNNISYGGRNKKGDLIVPNGDIQKACIFNGNFVCIPKNVFLKVGNLDSLFIHSIGDFDYGLRALKNGFCSYITPSYSGYFEKHDKPPLWCETGVSLIKRVKNLYSPLGNSHPYYYSKYILRHFGAINVFKNLITIHFRLLFPMLWLKRK